MLVLHKKTIHTKKIKQLEELEKGKKSAHKKCFILYNNNNTNISIHTIVYKYTNILSASLFFCGFTACVRVSYTGIPHVIHFLCLLIREYSASKWYDDKIYGMCVRPVVVERTKKKSQGKRMLVGKIKRRQFFISLEKFGVWCERMNLNVRDGAFLWLIFSFFDYT